MLFPGGGRGGGLNRRGVSTSQAEREHGRSVFVGRRTAAVVARVAFVGGVLASD